MIVVSLLAASALITSARASPTSDWLLLYDLYGQRSLESSDQPIRSANDIDGNYPMDEDVREGIADLENDRSTSVARTKKLGLGSNSLSIVNPVDVLRQRVLLELARRKAMQDQRQVDANRRMLAELGKRSNQNSRPDHPNNHSGPAGPENNSRAFINVLRSSDDQNQSHRPYTQRITQDDARHWYNVDDSVIRESASSSTSNNGDDETRKVLYNYHHDRV